MQQDSTQGMWGRYLLFIVLSIAVLAAHSYWMASRAPRKAEKPAQLAQREAELPKEGQAAGKEGGQLGAKPGADRQPVERPDTPSPEKPAEKPGAVPAEKPAQQPPVAEEPRHPDAFVTLGSLDPESPYRMLVTLTSRGAAVARVELNGRRYRDVEDRSGYLGQIVVHDDPRAAASPVGCPVQVVGPGTPAFQAGLRPGDVITAVDGRPVGDWIGLTTVLAGTRPGQRVQVTLAGKTEPVTVTLARRPLEVLRPEGADPLSFLMTLARVDDGRLPGPDPAAEAPTPLNRELEELDLRTGNWQLVAHDEEHAVFRRRLARLGLELEKTYRLARVAEGQQDNPDYPAYHLDLQVAIRNLDGRPHQVAYQLDGPTGLPLEGWWYASKVSHYWFKGVGLRDVIASFGPAEPNVYSAIEIAHQEWRQPIPVEEARVQLAFVGVDAQYFSAVMIPQRQQPAELGFADWQPLAVGPVPKDVPSKTNTSFRLRSTLRELAPDATLRETFQIFVGPKRPSLLEAYGLRGILYYGYFWWAARPMLWLLHFFHDYLVFNYGLAIIMLTVVVRGCMFPLSRKQALGAQKMQEIQPELKRLKEKYKNDLQALGRAQRELFAKYNYNPWGGCLIVFLQLPIFVGLYRALMVDVELRGAPLLSEKIRWASNLAGPDMLFDWSGFMPGFITRGVGLFGLGPYFNILPIITVALFLWQQKKFMPPPADEQAALNMKVMQWMMVFMGLLFYKVASGLCIYFIASTLWSIAERKFLPKLSHAAGDQPRLPEKRAEEKPVAYLPGFEDVQRVRRPSKKKRFRRKGGW